MIFDSKKGYERWDVVILLAKEYGCKKLAEIGVYKGENAKIILSHGSSFNLEHLFLVDPYDPNYPYSLPFISWVFTNKMPASFLKMLSIDASTMFEDNSLDLVFIDADHKYESVKNDINAWIPKIRKRGIICGHDYGGSDNGGLGMHPGVKQAVDEAFGDRVNTVPVTRVRVWWVQL